MIPDDRRMLALDVGDRRIGIARSDASGILASPVGVYHRRDQETDLDYIVRLVGEQEAKKVVVGLPVNMSGSEGPQAAKIREFALELRKRGIEVDLWDERLSTVEATRMLEERGMTRKKIQKRVDEMAAMLILDAYLLSVGRGGLGGCA